MLSFEMTYVKQNWDFFLLRLSSQITVHLNTHNYRGGSWLNIERHWVILHVNFPGGRLCKGTALFSAFSVCHKEKTVWELSSLSSSLWSLVGTSVSWAASLRSSLWGYTGLVGTVWSSAYLQNSYSSCQTHSVIFFFFFFLILPSYPVAFNLVS